MPPVAESRAGTSLGRPYLCLSLVGLYLCSYLVQNYVSNLESGLGPNFFEKSSTEPNWASPKFYYDIFWLAVMVVLAFVSEEEEAAKAVVASDGGEVEKGEGGGGGEES